MFYTGVAVSNKNVSPINSQNSGPKECKKKKKKDRKSTPHIQVPLALALYLIPGCWGRPCEVSEGGECSVSGRRSPCYIVVVVQKSCCCGSPLALLTGSGNTSTPSTGLFQDHFPRLPWLHSCNFQVSTVPHVPAEHENSPTIFTRFRSMQCCVRCCVLSFQLEFTTCTLRLILVLSLSRPLL